VDVPPMMPPPGGNNVPGDASGCACSVGTKSPRPPLGGLLLGGLFAAGLVARRLRRRA
jgi:MYXO-CTERM domain-containing protein